jgi:hypothetical protein
VGRLSARPKRGGRTPLGSQEGMSRLSHPHRKWRLTTRFMRSGDASEQAGAFSLGRMLRRFRCLNGEPKPQRMHPKVANQKNTSGRFQKEANDEDGIDDVPTPSGGPVDGPTIRTSGLAHRLPQRISGSVQPSGTCQAGRPADQTAPRPTVYPRRCRSLTEITCSGTEPVPEHAFALDALLAKCAFTSRSSEAS